jgi:NADPH:quinone reductase-like Zn-dependent oxidoreductase
MKNTPLILVAAFGLTVTFTSLALARGEENKAPNDSSVWSTSQAATIPPADPAMIQGTVSAVDAQAGSITVSDAAGASHTFSVMRGEELQNINPGDRVNVTPDLNNGSAAQSIEKDPASQPQP